MAQVDTPPRPIIRNQSRLAWIWIVPVVSLLVGAWLIYDYVREQGVAIEIRFSHADGLVAGRTPIRYHGVEVGRVERFELSEDLTHVTVHARLQRHAEKLAVDGSQFWIVRPRIGLDQISGLDTLIGGPYLGVSPGSGGDRYAFEGLDQPPRRQYSDSGYAVIVRSPRLHALNVGAPVYYREFPVGEVAGYELTDDGRFVDIELHIGDRYIPLVRQGSMFWVTSGLVVDSGLLGIGAKLNVGSLKSLVMGGISFATPDQPGDFARPGHVFELHEELRDQWLKWSPAIPLDHASPPL